MTTPTPFEIRKAVVTAIRAVHPRVYFQRAPEGAEYPYVAYSLTDSYDDGSLDRWMVDVDVWDRSNDGDSLRIELLADAVDKALNGLMVVPAPDLSFRFLRENRLTPETDDPRLLRRWYTYQVRVYERRR